MQEQPKIQAIIVDDEKHCLETLSWQIQHYCPQIQLRAECRSGEEAMGYLKSEDVHLVFLDIEMPRMNGFELLQQFEGIHFEVIFTTAYDMFAVKAFKFSALDYLLKPIDKDELIKAVEKVNLKRPGAYLPGQLDILFESLYKKTHSGRVALPTMEGLEFVQAADVIHCQSDSNYTYLYLISGKKMLISKTLKETEEILAGHNFMRVHHSHLINLNHIRKYIKGDGGYVVMTNDQVVNVSRSRKDDLLRAF